MQTFVSLKYEQQNNNTFVLYDKSNGTLHEIRTSLLVSFCWDQKMWWNMS